MLFFAVCWIWISVASLNYEDLVADVENTLDECLNIVEDAWLYVAEVDSLLGDVRRRDEEEDGSHAIKVKLSSCISLQKAVDDYRDAHSRLLLVQNFVHVQEKAYLNQLLASESKEIGLVPLYIASKDGDGAANFHDKCDNKGPTVVIVESTDGYVFGGYTDQSWSFHPWYASASSSTTSFLFQLRPNFSQYNIKDSDTKHAIIKDKTRGPIFGNWKDLGIADQALNNSDSITLGHTYHVEQSELNGGVTEFKVRDYVVFEAIALKN